MIMDRQNSLKKPLNPYTSFLWGLLAFSLSYFLIKSANLDFSSSSGSTVGMPLTPDFTVLIEIFLTYFLAFLLLMIILRPSVNGTTFVLSGFLGPIAAVGVIFVIIVLMIRVNVKAWPVILEAMLLSIPAYLAFGAMFATLALGKTAIPLFLKIFGIACVVLTLVSIFILGRFEINEFLISLIPQLEPLGPGVVVMLLMPGPLAVAGLALYNRQQAAQPGAQEADANLPRS